MRVRSAGETSSAALAQATGSTLLVVLVSHLGRARRGSSGTTPAEPSRRRGSPFQPPRSSRSRCSRPSTFPVRGTGGGLVPGDCDLIRGRRPDRVHRPARPRPRAGRGVPARQSPRRECRRGSGSGIVVFGSATVVYNDPAHTTGELVFVPVLFAHRLAGRLRAARAGRAGGGGRGARAAQAERERDAAARIAVAEERARIARELHDIVAHAVSVMVLQVGAVRHKLPDSLTEDGDALRGRRARPAATRSPRCGACSAAMRTDGERGRAGPPARPRRASRRSSTKSGAPACRSSCTSRGSAVLCPARLDLSAYRIVQEGLTNVRKHARGDQGGRDAPILTRGDPDRDPRRRRRAARPNESHGYGLVGVRERVKIYGGEMTTGIGERRRLHPQHAPAARRADADEHPRARGRRPVDGAGRLPHAARRTRRTSRSSPRRATGSRRSRRQARYKPDGRAHGHPHARARRPRGDPAHPRGRRRGASPDPHDLRPRRVRVRGAPRSARAASCSRTTRPSS